MVRDHGPAGRRRCAAVRATYPHLPSLFPEEPPTIHGVSGAAMCCAIISTGSRQHLRPRLYYGYREWTCSCDDACSVV